MKEKFYRFMQGRYGADQLSRFLIGLMVALLIVNLFARNPLLDILVFALMIWGYFRMFSRNIPKRYGENQKYLQVTQKIRYKFNREKSLMQQRKTHHIYRCPGCKQQIRIPKGKGKIQITCPKCRMEFIKNS